MINLNCSYRTIFTTIFTCDRVGKLPGNVSDFILSIPVIPIINRKLKITLSCKGKLNKWAIKQHNDTLMTAYNRMVWFIRNCKLKHLNWDRLVRKYLLSYCISHRFLLCKLYTTALSIHLLKGNFPNIISIWHSSENCPLHNYIII